MSSEPCLPISFVDQLVLRILDGSKTQTRRLITEAIPPGADEVFFWAKPPADVGHGITYAPSGLWARRNNRVEDGDGFLKYLGPAPYRVGELRWVRESYEFLPRTVRQSVSWPERFRIRYAADGAERWVSLEPEEHAKLKARRLPYTKPQPGRFLYRSCARIFLRVASLRAERLQEISEEDARAEGVERIDSSNRPLQMEPGSFGFRNYGAADLPGESAEYFTTARESFFSLWDLVNSHREGARVADNPWLWVPGFQLEQVLVRGEGRAA